MGSRLALVLGAVAGVLVAIGAAAVVVALTAGGAVTVTLPPASAVPQPSIVGSAGSAAAGASSEGSPSAGPGSASASPGSPEPPAGPLASGGLSDSPGSLVPSGSPAPTAPSGPFGLPAPSGPAVPPATPPPSSPTGALFGVGRPAPPLVVDLLGGGTIDLAALRGKPVWVAFSGTYCPSCRDEYPFLESFATRYAQTGLVVIVVHEKDDPATVASLVRELGITFPVGLDPSAKAGRDWRIVALPIHFWVDRDGIVRAGALGGVGPDVMAQSLQTILPGVLVTQ